MTIDITLACTDYEWFEPMIGSDVEPDGIDLTVFTHMDGSERHRRTMRGEFDVAEFSLGTYITGWPDWEFTAIPAFPRRFFPHSRVFAHRDADIDEPADMEGKRVCITSYQNTLALWAKGVFSEFYDLDLGSVEWCAWKPEPVPVDLPVSVEVLEHDRSRADLLARHELDAVIVPYTGSVYPLHENVRRVFEDLEAAEREYYDRTGFYPLMHTVVVRDELVDEHPWLPTELLKTFRRSVDAFAERATYEAKYPLVWWQGYLEREREVFGDVWGSSFKFDVNADHLETMVRYAEEQGLIDEPFDPTEMFLEVGGDVLSR